LHRPFATTQARQNPALCLVAYRLSWPPSAQSPFARSGRYPRRGGLESRLEGRYPLVVAHTRSCARPSPSPRLGSRLARGVLAGCRQSLLGDGPSRRYLRDPCVGARTPTPPRLLDCACPLLHGGHRSHPTLDGFDARIYPHTATSVGSPISRLQSFAYLRAPTLARPPDCSDRSSPKAPGRPGLSHHASPGRLPEPGCGVATCSTRTISMAGLSPSGVLVLTAVAIRRCGSLGVRLRCPRGQRRGACPSGGPSPPLMRRRASQRSCSRPRNARSAGT
jgi:hypothetical protein